MDAHEVAGAIGVEIVGRLPHGESMGAYEVRLADGSRAVLKLFAGDVVNLAAATPLTDALRARGYPIPSIVSAGELHGTRYEIQQRMPGAPMEQATSEHVDAILELVRMQRDVGLPGRGPWLEYMIASVVDGCVGYCEHGAMLRYSDETRALLERIRRIAAAATSATVTDADIVHCDFSPLNLLSEGSRITGVVDWDGATNGDASFDLVTLALYTYDFGVRDKLLAHAAQQSDPRVLALYAAHMVLRQVDWTIRHHTALEVQWFMSIGTDLLTAVGAH